MILSYGTPGDIDAWMGLAAELRSNFPGLETETALEEYRDTVLRFMEKRQAIIVKEMKETAGIMLFSRGRNMICCLAVAPKYRRQGIASLMMEEALTQLDRTKEISVFTFRKEDEKGIAPRAFYEKFGFIADALTIEMNYPHQKYVLHPEGSERRERQRAINRMVDEIRCILSDAAPSVYLYGSSVLDDFRLGWSDIDILVLTEKEISEAQAKKLVSLRQSLMEIEPCNPYYRSFEGGMLSLAAFLSGQESRAVYWGTSGERIINRYSLDCFAMKQLQECGVLLYGKEIRSRLNCPPFDALYAGVKYHYETIRKYVQKTGRGIYSFGWMLDIARCIYTLRTGEIISKTKAGEWALENQLYPRPEALESALKVRKNPLQFRQDPDMGDKAEAMAEEIQRFADVLERELTENKGEMRI